MWKNYKFAMILILPLFFCQQPNSPDPSLNTDEPGYFSLTQLKGLQKAVLMLCILLFLVSCPTKQEDFICVGCPSVALRIKLQDSQDSSIISDAKITVINKTTSDTITVDSLYRALWGRYTFDGQYVVYGFPGEYLITITHPLFESFSLNAVNVSQWKDVTCEHANTENLIIGLDRLNLKKKRTNKPGGIISQKTEGHC
jgi:hypothetical protein